MVRAPRQRNTEAEKAAIRDGQSADEIWPEQPAKAAQKDTDARWTEKFTKAKPKPDGTTPAVLGPPRRSRISTVRAAAHGGGAVKVRRLERMPDGPTARRP